MYARYHLCNLIWANVAEQPPANDMVVETHEEQCTHTWWRLVESRGCGVVDALTNARMMDFDANCAEARSEFLLCRGHVRR